MAMFRVTTSGTFNLKLSSAGFIRAISCPAAGTTWLLTINDGPNPAGTVTALYGATPATVTTGLVLLAPLYFNTGLQIVTSGATPGELDIDVV